MFKIYTALKVPKYGVFTGPYFPVLSLNTGNTYQKKSLYFVLFTQCLEQTEAALFYIALNDRLGIIFS